MATGDRTQAPVPNAGTNQRFDKVDHKLIADTFSEHAETTHRTLISEPIAVAGSPTGELWVGTITSNPVPADGIVQVDSAFFAGLDADGGIVLVPEGIALQVAIPDDSSDYQVYLYTIPVAENSQVRRFMPSAPAFIEFPQAQNVHARRQAALHTRAGSAGSAVASDVAAGETRPLLFLGISNNTGGTVTFTPATNRLETITPPANLPTSSTGDVAGTTYSTGDQATVRGMTNAAMHAIARDRWVGSNNFTPSAANNYGAYSEVVEGLDVAVRKHTDFITVGEDSSGVFGTFNRDDYPSDDLLLVDAIAALPPTGGTVYIKPGFTLDNFLADISIPASTRVRFVSDSHRTLGRTTFDLGTFKFVCASGGSLGQVAFENCTFLTADASHLGGVIELHDDFEFIMRGCYIAVSTANTAAPEGCVTVNAGCTDLKSILIEDCSLSYTCSTVTSTGVFFLHVPSTEEADDITIKDSSFICTGDLAGTFGGSIISLEEAGDDIVIDGCSFSSVGAASAPGNNLVGVQLASTSNDEFERHNRVVRDCTFRGRTTGALVGVIVGILATDIQDLSIRGCDFQSCQTDIRISQTTNLGFFRSNYSVKDCVFRDTGLSGVDLSASLGVTIRGFAMTGCEFHLSSFEGDLPGNLEDAHITENTFIDTSFRVGGLSSDGVHVDGNMFRGTTDNALLAPILGRSINNATLTGCSFSNNTVRGFHATTSIGDTVFGVLVRAGSSGVGSGGVSICDNRFYDLQDAITWTGGSSPDDNWHVLSVRITSGEAGPLRIDGNSFGKIGTGIIDSGAGTPQALAMIHVSNLLRDTGGGKYGSVSIQNNTSGDVSALPLFWENTAANILTVANNTFSYHVVDLLVAHADFYFETNIASGSFVSITIEGNHIHRDDGAVAVGHWLEFADTQFTTNFILRDNVTDFSAMASNSGVELPNSTASRLVVTGNVSDVAGMNFNINAWPGVGLSLPADPGVNPIPDNIQYLNV